MSANDRSVRIGPISLFTLIAVLCLATLAVLSITTANASYNMAELQGSSVGQQYAAESAAQDFLAQIDGRGAAAASASGAGGTDATQAQAQPASGQLDAICARVEERTPGVSVTAKQDGSLVTASFTCANERVLEIAISLSGNGSYTIEKWNMTAKVNEAETGTLWSGI